MENSSGRPDTEPWRKGTGSWLIALSGVSVAIALAFSASSGSRILWFVAGILAITGLVFLVVAYPESLFSIVYPLFSIVGQIPLPLGDGTVSVERALVVLGGIGIGTGIFLTRRLTLLRLPRFVAIGLLVWLGCYLVSYSIHPSERGAVQLFGFFQKAILGYIVYICLADSRRMHWAAAMFLVASFLASLVTVYAYFITGSLQFIRVSSFVAVNDSVGEALFRGLARVGAGNTMAVWISMIFFKQSRQYWKRLLWGIIILWFVFLSFFALRREVLVVLPLGMAVLFWHRPVRLRRELIALTSMALIIGAISLATVPEWKYRLFTETSEELSESADPRITLLGRFTPAAVSASPWFGHGPGNYEATQILFPEKVTSEILAVDGIAPHNSWSAAAVEAGIFAFAGLCLMVYGIGRLLWRRRTTGDRKLDSLWAVAPLVFIQIMATMFFGDGITVSQTWFWIGFLMALSLVTRRASIQVKA